MLIKRKEEMADLFKYELTSEPSPLFKADMLRKANMAELRNRILQFDMRIDEPNSDVYIIDVGALLQRRRHTPVLCHSSQPARQTGKAVICAFCSCTVWIT